MSRAAAPTLAEKYIPVGRGRLCRNLEEQVTHPATVIGRMVDDVHEDLAARHRARLTGHESKRDAWLLAWSDRQSRRSEEHTSELQSLTNLVCRLLLEKKKKKTPLQE